MFVGLLLYLYSLLFLILVSAFLIYLTLDVLLTGKTPLVTTPHLVWNRLITAFELKDSDTLIDMGCGNALFLIKCAKRYPNGTFIGIDNSLWAFLLSRVYVKLSQTSNVHIRWENFFNSDLSNVTHIYMWLFTNDMDKLLPKIEKELKPGGKVFSLDFKFKHKEPLKSTTINTNAKFGHTLYTYEF